MTHFVESPDSSPLSGRYPLTPSSSFPPIQSSDNAYDQKNHEIVHSQYLQSTNTVSLAIPSESQCLIPLASDDAHVSRLVIPSTPEKHSAKCDSYETDSVSMGSSKRENGKKDKGGKVETVPPVPSYAPDSSADSFFTIESTSDSTFDFSILRRRVQPFRKAPSGPSSMSVSPSFDSPGYETDGGKKSKKKKSGGHDKNIRKAKSLFFRLGNKSSKGDLGKDSSKSVALKMNSTSLPSAERFVTALNKETGAPMIALGADQLLVDASSPGLGIDLQLRLSGELFSAPAPCISSSPQLKVPVHVGTPDSAISSPTSQAQNRLLPALTVPTLQKCSSSSFPSSSTPIVPGPGSAAIVANNRTSTSTNTTNALSYSTGAARSSIATSISTSQSHAAKPGMLSRQSSNTGFPALPIPNLSSGLSSFHLTPNKRRVLPFISMQKFRNSASSSDSLEKEKERKREIEKERERERETKKPLISLPLNGDSNKASGFTTLTRGPSMNLPRLSIPDLSLPIKLDGFPVKPSVESGSGCPFPWLPLLTSPNGPQSSPGLSRQASLPKSQPPSNTLRPDNTFSPMAGPMPTISSDRTSPMPRSHGIDGVGSPLSGSRLSGLSSSSNVSTYYNIPALDPPPPSPLPDVPTDETTVPRSNGSRHLAVDVDTARTIDSSLPSPVLGSSPPYGSAAIGNTKTQRSAFTNLSAAAGNALRAKVQRRPNQQGGFSKSSTNGATTPTTDSSPISIVPPSTINNMPGPIRAQSSRGHESLFPSSPSHTPTTNNISRAMLSRFAWEKSSNSEWQNTYVDDREMMEGDVFARSRGSKILDLGFEKTADEVIPTKRSHLAVQHVTENAPLHSSIIVDDSRYDGLAVEEYYRSTNYGGASTPIPGVYDDYPEDASHYPEDEMSIRHSRCRRSTVYISDEEEGGSNSGHGYGSSKNRRRYSDSIYSRASFLDTEKSGEMRQRFLKHVETMLNERGRPTYAIPPVPRLPEEFVAEHKRAAAAARKEYIMKNTIGTGFRKVPVGPGR